MPCFKPLKGYRSRTLSKNGKRPIVFNAQSGYRDRPVTVPCGQCIGCRLERSRQWAMRCTHEAQLYPENCFVTLTYDDEHLPFGSTLVKTDLQKFMKRLRKRFPQKIRFYSCGEYGENFCRPHYHLCLFNCDFDDKYPWTKNNGNIYYRSETLEKLWPFGFSLIGELTFESAAYTARYILKKQLGPDAAKHYETADPETGEIYEHAPEFTTMSLKPGIGAEWLQKYRTDVYDFDFVVIKGKKMKPPKYYDRVIEVEYPSDYKKIRRQRILGAKLHTEDQTPARLRDREICTEARLRQLPRNLEENP